MEKRQGTDGSRTGGISGREALVFISLTSPSRHLWPTIWTYFQHRKRYTTGHYAIGPMFRDASSLSTIIPHSISYDSLGWNKQWPNRARGCAALSEHRGDYRKGQ
ncbi:hypothetical protein CSUB01_02023 [Colletotrichum sublineola]|uniref:Uncharacterized protein n=1 Tax=Colletotrichum sublineola TaxID=1173701 RepID=A0A066XNT3_COLSU|nr:hypothetical protein CSUB01_02023 [Colletotrichum sublineola]